MAKKDTNRSNVRLLVNAEPFGFGPTAAIAAFFSYLRSRFSHIGFIGKGHTLDLQTNLGYDEIFDISNVPGDQLKEIFSKYDLFVTAMDFDMARMAKANGLRVVIYDALAWYWEELPDIIRESELYIAQDFFNVKERIGTLANARVVPPIISGTYERKPEYVLINLGGLQNPLWRVEDAAAYASLIVRNLRKIIPDDNLLIATSKAISEKLEGPVIKSFSRDEMLKILAKTKCAFMTPGLGNIYDAAQYGIPTVWLPPANTSQGQQAVLLKHHGMADAFINWPDILEVKLSYEHRQNQQPKFLARVREFIGRISRDSNLERKLEMLCADAFKTVYNKDIGAARGLLEKFGTGGAEKTVDLIYKYAK